MGLIKEPFDLDFFFDPKPVSKEEIQKISDYIKSEKKILNTKKKHNINSTEHQVSPSNLF